MTSDRTLQELNAPVAGGDELQASANKAKAAIMCWESKNCGTLIVVYTDKEYTNILLNKNGKEITRSSNPYKIIRLEKSFVTIDSFENGGVGTIYFIENGFYFNTKIDEFTFKEYYARHKINRVRFH